MGPTSWPRGLEEEQIERLDREPDDGPASHLISLVFWYKDDNPAPIYTLDARQAAGATLAELSVRLGQDGGRKQRGGNNNSSGGTNHRHRPHSDVTEGPLNQSIGQLNERLLANAKHYSSNARLTLRLDWPLLKLRLGPLAAADSGAYRCRIDFRRARTRLASVQLLVQGEFGGPAGGSEVGDQSRRRLTYLAEFQTTTTTRRQCL